MLRPRFCFSGDSLDLWPYYCRIFREYVCLLFVKFFKQIQVDLQNDPHNVSCLEFAKPR